MPVHADGYLIPFTAPQIAAMNIRTFDVRMGGHPVQSREVDQNTMVRKFLVKWTEQENFVELVCGRSKLWVDASGPSPVMKLSRLLPNVKFGSHPRKTQIVTTKINDMRGHGAGRDDADGMPAYEDAEIEVFYEQAPYVLRDDATTAGNERNRYVWRSQTGGAEAQPIGPLAGGMYKYVTAGGAGVHGNPVPFGVMVQRAVERFSLVWERIPYALYAAGGTLFTRVHQGNDAGGGVPDGVPYLGAVNSTALNIPGLGNWSAERLLFEKIEAASHREPRAANDFEGLEFRITFHFAYAARGWLDLLHPIDGQFHQAARDGVFHALGTMPDWAGIFNLRDLNSLFDPNY